MPRSIYTFAGRHRHRHRFNISILLIIEFIGILCHSTLTSTALNFSFFSYRCRRFLRNSAVDLSFYFQRREFLPQIHICLLYASYDIEALLCQANCKISWLETSQKKAHLEQTDSISLYCLQMFQMYILLFLEDLFASFFILSKHTLYC
jgi:hypothetical protein